MKSAPDELRYLDFNSSICQAMAKTMEHLIDFVSVSIVNLTLARRDSYLSRVKSGIKCPVRNACLYIGEVTPPDPHFLFAIASQP